MSLQVVALMLDDARQIGVDVLVMLLPVLVEVMDVDLGVASHILMNAGHTQAAFLTSLGGACLIDGNLGVDEHHALILELGELLAQGIHIDVYHPDAHAHLWSSDANAVAVVHGVLHVLDEFVKTWIVLVDGLCHLAQHGLTVDINW